MTLEVSFDEFSFEFFGYVLNQVLNEYPFDFVMSFFWVFLSGLEDSINESSQDHLTKTLQGLLYKFL